MPESGGKHRPGEAAAARLCLCPCCSGVEIEAEIIRILDSQNVSSWKGPIMIITSNSMSLYPSRYWPEPGDGGAASMRSKHCCLAMGCEAGGVVRNQESSTLTPELELSTLKRQENPSEKLGLPEPSLSSEIHHPDVRNNTAW